MSIHAVAADHLKCVRVLSVILADGTLPTPGTWSMHTYPGYEPPFPPTLEGMFFDNTNSRTPTAKDVRALLDVYAEKFGLAVEEEPHGREGLVGVHIRGRWQGVDLHVWGPARKDDGPALDDGALRTADDEAEEDGTHEGRFTDAQLDGTACSECGIDFAEGVAAVPTGLVIDGGQLFAHPDCQTDNTPTEPSGDAL